MNRNETRMASQRTHVNETPQLQLAAQTYGRGLAQPWLTGPGKSPNDIFVCRRAR